MDNARIYTAMQAVIMVYNAFTYQPTISVQNTNTYMAEESMTSIVEVAEIEECTLTQDIEEQLEVVITEMKQSESTQQEEESEDLENMFDLCTDAMDVIDIQKEEENKRREEEMEFAGKQENQYGY